MSISEQPNLFNGKLETLVADLAKTRPTEIYCEEAANQMVRCVFQPLDEAEAQARFPDLFHHLALCPDCAAEYALLMALQADPDGAGGEELPMIPPLPARFLAPTDTIVSQLIRILFSGFSPLAATGALRGNQLGFAPVAISLGENGPTLALRLQRNSTDPDLRTLVCTLHDWSPMPSRRITPTIALEASDGALLDEQPLDPDGEVFFEEIVADQYALRLQLTGNTYLIEDIVVP